MDIEAYYNNISDKLITDYLYENPRTLRAIKFTLSHIPTTSHDVLDLGCGIGWTTFEFARHLNEVAFEGIDLSTNLIKIARTLFSLENLDFKVSKFNNLNFKSNYYDAIVMIDVYEHVSPTDRPHLIKFFNESLTRSGRIILTCPTRKHQEYLKNNFVDQLQPVDEIIEKSELEELANGIGGEIVNYKEVSIWQEKDYFHAVISRKSILKNSKKNIYNSEGLWSKYSRVTSVGLYNKTSRFRYILRRLKNRWTR